MKIKKSLLLAVGALAIGISDVSYAQVSTPESCFKMSKTTLVEYMCSDREVSIPAVIQGTKVTSIGERAFYKNQLESIVIQGSVTWIGWGAFANNQLKSVWIPSSTMLEPDAFDKGVKILRKWL